MLLLGHGCDEHSVGLPRRAHCCKPHAARNRRTIPWYLEESSFSRWSFPCQGTHPFHQIEHSRRVNLAQAAFPAHGVERHQWQAADFRDRCMHAKGDHAWRCGKHAEPDVRSRGYGGLCHCEANTHWHTLVDTVSLCLGIRAPMMMHLEGENLGDMLHSWPQNCRTHRGAGDASQHLTASMSPLAAKQIRAFHSTAGKPEISSKGDVCVRVNDA